MPQLKILIIEDDSVDLMAYKRAIHKTEFGDAHIENAIDALHAFDKLKEQQFDCIFLDYQLPGQNGLELLTQIREKGYTMPVAVVTSQGDERLAVQMMKAGAFDYFTKNEIHPDLLNKLLNNVQQFNKIAEERNEAEKRIKEQERFINKIATFSPNFIYVFDLEKRQIVFINHNLFKTLGYKKGDLDQSFEKAFNSIIHPNQYEEFKNLLLKLEELDEENVAEIELRLRDSQNHYNWLYARNVSFKRNESGKTTQVLGTAINITSRKRSEEELLIAKQQAEHAAKAKSEFLSNMSHEIRTPMNAIIGLSDILLNSNFKGEDLTNLKTIKNSADNLLVIINDILDFSKIEAGKLNFENIPFSLEDGLEHVRKTMEFKAKDKGIYLNIEKSTDVPLRLKGDPFRLNQILINLIGNAIKFTKEGGITVKVSTSEASNNHEKPILKFEVIDTGIGIPEEKQQSIFESFSQAYTDISRNYGGTGLGLTITRRLVELQGGKLGLKSEKNKGSNFYFTLPFERSTKAPEVKSSNSSSLSEDLISGMRILVAEDNPVNQMLIKQVLSKWNVSYSICNNGQEAVDHIEENQYDVVLMDLQMPIMDGITAANRIRTGSTPNKSIPIIALTADAFVETRQRVIEEGFTDYLTKPFKRNELLDKLVSAAN